MAFAFFRRRQKLVVILMIILMISFLVTLQGLSMLTERREGSQTFARTRAGEMELADLWSAGQDLQILAIVGRQVQLPGEVQVLMQVERGDLYYALLLAEAEENGIVASDADVTAFLSGLGYSEEAYHGLIEDFRQGRARLTESRVREALANVVKVYRSIVAAEVDVPPSEREVRQIAAQQMEAMALEVVQIPAGRFVGQAPDPNEREIEAHFQAYREYLPGTQPTPEGFLFGYRVPDRVQLAGLLIRRNVLASVAQPAEADVRAFYADPRNAQMLRDGNQRMRLSEARPMIVARLRDRAVTAQTQELIRLVGEHQKRYDQAGPDSPERAGAASSFEYAVDRMRMTGPRARKLLDTRASIYINDKTVSEALDALAEQTGIGGVYFPTALDANRTLDPNVRVKIAGTMTVEKALAEISRQSKWPVLNWQMCQGIEGVLFPVEGEGFPLKAVASELAGGRELLQHEVFGSAIASEDDRMVQLVPLAFDVPAIQADPNRPTRMQLGVNGPTMIVLPGPGVVQSLRQILSSDRLPPAMRNYAVQQILGQADGALMWRVTEAERSYAPTELTPGLKSKVIEDLKLRWGFDRARTASRQIDSPEAFEQAAETYPTTRTEPVSRQELLAGQAGLEFLTLPRSRAASSQARQAFTEAVFSPELLPENPEGPFPAASEALVVQQVPASLVVTVIRRIGYEPMLREDYLEARDRIYAQLASQYRQIQVNQWIGGVMQRMEFRQAQP